MQTVESPVSSQDISIQQVGHEFVRLYYTTLNSHPNSLPSLYTDESTFIHDGLNGEKSVTEKVGVEQIKDAIIALGFVDCRTKIEQIDSSSGCANSIVIQVIGEMSNNGQPCRRFAQTIVLGQSSSHKYYVHNMILRFQDDDALEESLPIENGVEIIEEATTISSENIVEEESVDSTVVVNGDISEVKIQEEALVNGEVEEPVREETHVEEEEIKNEKPEDLASPTPITNTKPEAPQSWAKLLSSKPSFTPPKKPEKAILNPVNKPAPKEKPSGGSNSAPPNPPPKKEEPSRTKNALANKYSDDQQLFVGNLALNYTEEEMKGFFSQFGKVLDMKINRKLDNSYSKNSKVPNFGYVVFDNADSCKHVLEISPIYYQARRINVEQKMVKPRYNNRPKNGPINNQNKRTSP